MLLVGDSFDTGPAMVVVTDGFQTLCAVAESGRDANTVNVQ
jgi:hypothetical protein